MDAPAPLVYGHHKLSYIAYLKTKQNRPLDQKAWNGGGKIPKENRGSWVNMIERHCMHIQNSKILIKYHIKSTYKTEARN